MPTNEDSSDLGFTFRARKSGEIDIQRGGRTVTSLRGSAAADFLARVAGRSDDEQQQVMARLTGNYRRGNERLADQHRRNRGGA